MTLTFDFQMMLRVDDLGLEPPPPPNFKALAAQCDDDKIIAIDYIGPRCYDKALKVDKKPLTVKQQQLAGRLETGLRAYLHRPESPATFECLHNPGLPLCDSMLSLVERGKRIKNLPPERWEKRAKVRERVRRISSGKVRPYSAIARTIKGWDNPGGYRATGRACGNSPFAIVIPCFRVVYKDGSKRLLGELGNNAYLAWEFKEKRESDEVGRQIKRWLIEREGRWKVETSRPIPPKRARLCRVTPRKD